MTTILESITEVVIPLMGTVFSVMTENPLLTAFIAISLVSAGVGLFSRVRRAASGR